LYEVLEDTVIATEANGRENYMKAMLKERTSLSRGGCDDWVEVDLLQFDPSHRG
jgi:hypothetical protein